MKLRILILLFAVLFLAGTVDLRAEALAQGPLGGPAIAQIEAFNGVVVVSRAATPQQTARVTQINFQLANGDKVQTLAGMAQIRFTDASIITMNPGTIVVISQRQVTGGIQRTITQYLGNLWFNITKATGAGGTSLQTPTAVAAIRGTTGTQDVPNPDQSTHALQEGLEVITENVTQQSVTLRPGQRVTAVRGIGFTPVVALVGALIQPAVGGGGAAGGGGGGAAGGAGGTAGSTAGAVTGSVATTTATSVSSLAATVTSVSISASAAVATATVPLSVPAASSASGTAPLSPPGGALRPVTGRALRPAAVEDTAASAQTAYTPAPMNQYLNPAGSAFARMGSTAPTVSAAGALWLAGIVKHDQHMAYTGQKATQSILIADVFAGGMKQLALRQTSRYIDYRASGNAVRTFALASVIRQQYHNKPLAVIGAYGFAAAASFGSMSGPKRFPTDVVISAAVGEVIGRVLAHHRHDSSNRD